MSQWKVTRNMKLLFSFLAILTLSFFGVKESGDERHTYDIFSVGVAHAEVPYDSNYIPGCSATGATSSAAGTAGVAGCDADAGADGASGGEGGS